MGWGGFCRDHGNATSQQTGWKQYTPNAIEIVRSDDDGDKGLDDFWWATRRKRHSFLWTIHITKSDDQWLYLPALKRVKRISSRNKSGPFMGSEFGYEDLSRLS